MQDRYIADIGDFGKYGLLRALCGMHGGPSLRLGVVWYLVPDEPYNNDGKYTRYLQELNPAFLECDSVLYNRLRSLLVDEAGQLIMNCRRVETIETSELLPRKTIFHTERLVYLKEMSREERLSKRQKWLERALEATGPADLVFLDPDNGIECKSVGRAALKGPKYVFWDEIESFVRFGKSVVVYHHLGRSCSWREQVARLLEQFRERMPKNFAVSALIYKRGTGRAYFVVAATKHRHLLKNRLAGFRSSPWNNHFEGGGHTDWGFQDDCPN